MVAAQTLSQAGLVAGIAQRLDDAAVLAFMHSFAGGCLVAAGVAAAGALVVFFLLPARPRAHPDEIRPPTPADSEFQPGATVGGDTADTRTP